MTHIVFNNIVIVLQYLLNEMDNINGILRIKVMLQNASNALFFDNILSVEEEICMKRPVYLCIC